MISTPHRQLKGATMNERLELISLLLSLTEEELAEVISRAEKELGLQFPEEHEPPRPLPA